MNLAVPERPIPIPEYLEGELRSDIRHEYVAGQVYAMAGAGEKHNLIALNIASRLRSAVRGTPCRAFISDMKVRVGQNDAFYYPDVMVACDPQDTESLYKRSPCLIVEVLSPATEAIDRREKFFAYRSLPSLRHYLLVSQDQRRVEWHSLGEGGGWLFTLLEKPVRWKFPARACRPVFHWTTSMKTCRFKPSGFTLVETPPKTAQTAAHQPA
ncbi:MAG: Uma2 family endonuclease [Sulfuricella sp.]